MRPAPARRGSLTSTGSSCRTSLSPCMGKLRLATLSHARDTVATMICVRELRKSYGAIVAVDGVSFEIAARETFALLGPNGAGKTTTIHILVGLIPPDSGQI